MMNGLTLSKSPFGLHYDAEDEELMVALNGKVFTFVEVDRATADEFAREYCIALADKMG